MSSNIFAALDEEEEPKTVAAPHKDAAKKPAAAGTKPPPSVVKAVAVPAEEARARRTEAPVGGKAPRGGHREGFSGRGREFDRKSGTGRGSEVSKGGAGPHNWGSAVEVVKPEGEVVEEGAAPAAEGEAEAPAYVPEVDNTRTYEDIEKERAAKRSGAMFETVKEDTSELQAQFKSLLKKEKAATADAGLEALKKVKKMVARAEKAPEPEKLVLDYKLPSTAPPREDRSDRGRGGGRGGFSERGGRGGFGGDRPARTPESGEGGSSYSPRGGRGGFSDRGGRGGFSDRGGRGGFADRGRGASRGGRGGPVVVTTGGGNAVAVNDVNFPAL